MNMLLTEFDQEKYERTIFSEGYDEGHAKGYEDAKREYSEMFREIDTLKAEIERLRKLLGSDV